jgi:hypothetical protein
MFGANALSERARMKVLLVQREEWWRFFTIVPWFFVFHGSTQLKTNSKRHKCPLLPAVGTDHAKI